MSAVSAEFCFRNALRTAHATALESVAEGNVHVTRGLHELAIRWDKL